MRLRIVGSNPDSTPYSVTLSKSLFLSGPHSPLANGDDLSPHWVLAEWVGALRLLQPSMECENVRAPAALCLSFPV